MENELKKAYKLLIPTLNDLLFGNTQLPVEDKEGYKLCPKFIENKQALKANQDPKKVQINTHELIIKNFYNSDIEKYLIPLLLLDNLELLLYIHYELDKIDISQIDKLANPAIYNYMNNTPCEDMLHFLEIQYIFIFEMEFVNDYVSKNQYNSMLNRLSKRLEIRFDFES